MRKLLTLSMVLSVASATAQTIVPINDGGANQNVRDLGFRTIDKGLILPIWDTTVMNQYFTQLAPGQRKEGALGRAGNYVVWFRNGKWSPLSAGGSGGGEADGNNYPTSVTFNNGIITIQRDGLGPITSNSLDARYSLSSHTHPISAVIGLSDTLTANRFYGYLPNESEPSTPTNGVRIYAQDGALKCKGSSGTVTVIALP